MYLSTFLRLWGLSTRKPRLLYLATNNFWGQLRRPYYKRRIDGYSAPPEQIAVIVTDTCNFRCPMCQYAFSDSPGYRLNQKGNMEPKIFRKLMDETPGRPLVTLTGGEPLLHPQVSDLIAYAHAKGCPTTLTTNGWFLKQQAQTLCKAGLDLLIISVDGPSKIHNRIRGDKAFEHLAEGVDAILRLPKRPVVFLSMAISDFNSDQLIPMYDLALDWGVDGFNYNHLYIQTDEMVNLHNEKFASIFTADQVSWDVHPEKVDIQEITDAVVTIKRRSWRNRLIVIESPFLSRRETELWYHNPCRPIKWETTRCAWLRMRVWPDGSMKACRDWTVGNIAQEHVMDVWNGSRFRNFRRLLVTQGTIPLCARCCYMVVR